MAILVGLFLFAALTTPLAFWVLGSTFSPGTVPTLPPNALIDFAKFYYPQHYFFLDQTLLKQVVGVSLALTTSVVSVLHFRKRYPLLPVIAIFLLSYIAVDAVAHSFFPSRLYLQIHFLRSGTLSFILGSAMLAALTLQSLKDGISTSSFVYAVALLAFHGHLFPITLVVVIFEALRSRTSGRLDELSKGFAAVVAPLSLAGLVVVHVFFTVRLMSQIRPDFANDKELISFCRQAEDLIPEDALVAVPPSLNIRAFLRRNIFVTRKDGAAYLWKKGYELEYLRRLAVVGVQYTPNERDLEKSDREYHDNLEKQLQAMVEDGIDFAIASCEHLEDEGRAILRGYGLCLVKLQTALRGRQV